MEVREKLIWRIWAEIWRNYGQGKRKEVGKGIFEKKEKRIRSEKE